jgi:predicted ABC-type ATPase
MAPALAAVTAGRVVLRELDRLVESRAEFACESTLSGLQYARRIADWKRRGYLIEIVYLRLASPKLALNRVEVREAARTARKIARMYGTPIYVWENGKVVAKDPNDIQE